MTVSSPPAIELVFDRRLRVAGETVEGDVQFYFPSVVAENISEVVVRLCGGVVTTVTQFQGHGIHVRKNADLVYEEHLLWKTGDVYPYSDSHTLRLPFQFKLSDALPPSCDYPCFVSGTQGRGTVAYFVEVLGRRIGLHPTLKISSVLSIVPWSTAGASSHAHLTVYGWSGRWKSIGETKDIRRGFRGDRSRVEVSVRVPDIAGLPVNTPVPFAIDIVTLTKPTSKTDLSPADSVWPAPPSRVEDLEFMLEKTCFIKAGKGVEPTFEHLFVAYLGGMGPKGKAKQEAEVTVEKKEKVWLPCSERQGSKPMGQWKQEVIFTSCFNLNCVPSFETETFSLRYNGQLKLTFPGMGNKVKLDVPIKVVSCVASPETRTPWDAPPPPLDLPRSYFELEGWHAEEKDINLLYY